MILHAVERVSVAEGRALLAQNRRRQTGPTDWADVLAAQLHALHLPEPVREFVFHPIRRWRMDLAWPDRLLFAEVDGSEWTHGRHGRGRGMQSDCMKWNEAMLLGWTGCRFLGSHVKSGYAIDVLQQVLRT